jgi:hypothetical protein
MTDDLEAFTNAFRYPWSTGPVEGHITRVELIKRAGYGRANLALLRARILGPNWARATQRGVVQPPANHRICRRADYRSAIDKYGVGHRVDMTCIGHQDMDVSVFEHVCRSAARTRQLTPSRLVHVQ